MSKKVLITLVTVASLGLGSLLTPVPAQAKNMMNFMNPSKWFGGDNDHDYYRGYGYGPYGYPGYGGYGYPGYGWGGYPGYGWGGYPGYGWGGYPGYGGYGAPAANTNTAPPPATPQ